MSAAIFDHSWILKEALVAGELDNTVPGRVTGWIDLAGFDGRVTIDLRGDFHRDIRGAKIILTGNDIPVEYEKRDYMKDFSLEQVGDVGHITAGLPPCDYTDFPYIEWYSDISGRIFIELDPYQVKVVGRPTPFVENDPIDPYAQATRFDLCYRKLTKYYPLADRLVPSDWNGLVHHTDMRPTCALYYGEPILGLTDPAVSPQRVITVAARPTGERRCPCKGEWYLSGGRAWRAQDDALSHFRMLKLVVVMARMSLDDCFPADDAV